MSVHSATYAAQYVPQTRAAAPFWGHKPPEKGEFVYADHCSCPKFTKIYTNIQAHSSNEGAQNVPQMALCPPKGGQNLPERGEFVLRH